MQPSQYRPALRFTLNVIIAISILFSLLVIYALMQPNLASFPRAILSLVISVVITVACYRKLASLDATPRAGLTISPAEASEEQIVGVYDVTYKGGLPEYPQSRLGKIQMKIGADCFTFIPTLGTKKWFSGLTIAFKTISDVQVVQRQVNTLEGILGGLDSRQLNQANNIHITFRSADDRKLVLRLEMLSGLTVMGQAAKCLEFEDRLRTAGIRRHFLPASASSAALSTNGIPEQIERLADLRDRGLITALEYDTKKAELLSRM